MSSSSPPAYFEPETVVQAARLLEEHGREARILAGGCNLLPDMRSRRVQPSCLVSIMRIPGLGHVDRGAQGLKIGARATLRALELAIARQQGYLPLSEALRSIASFQVRTTGTAVGNLCVATPASDIAPPLLALGAEIRVVSATSERAMPLGDLFAGARLTSLRPGEIVTEVIVPPPPDGSGGAFAKLARTAADCAKVNISVLLSSSHGRCTQARIVLGSIAPTPLRVRRAEEILEGRRLDLHAFEECAEAVVELIRPITDIRSTCEYRKQATRALVKSTVAEAWARSGR